MAEADPPKGKEQEKDKKTGTAGFDKGFFVKSPDGNYAVRINARVQPFYTLTLGHEPLDVRNAFEIRRARLAFEGNIHTKSLVYKFETDFGRGNPTLKDFRIDVELAKGLWLRGGQWKRPFSRQQINSSGRLEISDRSPTDRVFLGSRDIGIAIHNNYEKSPGFEWVVSVFNGQGDAPRFVPTVDPMTGGVTGGSFTNIPGKLRPVVVARAGFNHGGIKGYSEADLEGGPLRFAAAANIAVEGDNDDDDKSLQRAGVDYVVKVAGFSSTGGFYVMSDQDEGDDLTAQALSFIGFHVQAGYMLTPKIGAAARYSLIDTRRDPDRDPARDQQEISIGGNYYAFGHDAKLAAAVRFIKTGDDSFTDGLLIEVGANVGF